MSDPTETARRQRVAEINRQVRTREAIEAKCGHVWDTTELQRDFTVLGFLAPYVVVERKANGVKGSLEFSHSPRYYFNFQED